MIDRLIEEIRKKGNPIVVGLDTRLEYIPLEFQESYWQDGTVDLSVAGKIIYAYNKAIIDHVWDVVPAVKLQMACYEMYGLPGMEAFQKTCSYASKKGLLVIGDGKRNDIGTTAEAYSAAYLGYTPLIEEKDQQAFPLDFITINPYLGYDGVHPFISNAEKYNKGLFILVKTSNPSSGQFQDLMVNGNRLYEVVGDYVKQWGLHLVGRFGYSRVGAVVGATYPRQGKELRERMSGVFFLVPGYGAQGASGDDLTGFFDEDGLGAIINSSRSILLAYRKKPWIKQYTPLQFAQAARKELLMMGEDIRSSLKKAGKLTY